MDRLSEPGGQAGSVAVCSRRPAKILPPWCIARLRPGDKPPIREDAAWPCNSASAAAARRGKGMVGMKIMAQGHLASDPQAAIRYAAGRTFLDSFIIGMLNRSRNRC